MPTLDELALKYGTDKSSAGHGYAKTYAEWLDPIRDQVRNVLEIGIDKGASLRMWSEYFPQARIFGIDRRAECGNLDLPPNCSVLLANAMNPAVLGELIKATPDKFDLVIDDGSHIATEQIAALIQFFPLLRDGGRFVIEDIHPYWFGTHMQEFCIWLAAEVSFHPQDSDRAGFWSKHLVAVEFRRYMASFVRGDNTKTHQ